MEIIECSGQEYQSVFKGYAHVFNSVAFNKLNETKCEQLKFLLFRDTKYRLGLIGGIREGNFICPFSAPFGSFSFTSEQVSVERIDKAVNELRSYAQRLDLAGIKIVLPPLLYHETFTAKLINALHRQRFEAGPLDLVYYAELENFLQYRNQLSDKARNVLKKSMACNIDFAVCDGTLQSIERVHGVLLANRQAKGRPMAMHPGDLAATAKVIPADFFLCTKDGADIAAAICYHVADDIIYIANWGDIPGAGQWKVMNFMAYHIFEYYFNLGKKVIDIGISTENGEPNNGLGAFKESIGCKVTPKFTYTYNVVTHGR